MAEETRKAGILSGLPDQWRQLSNPKKASAVVLITALFLTLFFVGQAMTKPRMSALFSGLDPAEAGKIVGRLKEMGVQYSLTNEGKTILVQEDRVYDLRIQLASDGALLGNGIGFELFDQTKLGTTDFNRRLDYQRALQEELRRTIVQLDEVEQARVHLALPEPSVFIQDSLEPSASIVLRLSPFSHLKKEQVRGILYLVAGSVENLRPENITIIDTQGNILNDALTENTEVQTAEATLRQYEVRRTFEKELERRVQGMLERVVGQGQAVAMVTAELDFDSSDVSVITFASEGVPRTSSTLEESFTGTGGTPLGEVGTDSNIPGYVFNYSNAGEATYSRREQTVQYEISETTERQLKAPGRLVRLHAAVVVNDKGGLLTGQQLEQIREVVSSAVGYQEGRGDNISVQGMNFDTSRIDEAREAMDKQAKQQLLQRYLNIGAIVLAALIVMLTLLRLFTRRKDRELEAELAGLPLAPEMAIVPVEEEHPQTEEQKLHEHVRHLAEKQPEVVAHLLRAWLAEE